MLLEFYCLSVFFGLAIRQNGHCFVKFFTFPKFLFFFFASYVNVAETIKLV